MRGTFQTLQTRFGRSWETRGGQGKVTMRSKGSFILLGSTFNGLPQQSGHRELSGVAPGSSGPWVPVIGLVAQPLSDDREKAAGPALCVAERWLQPDT